MRGALRLGKAPPLSLFGVLSLFWLCLLVLSITWSFEGARWVSSLPSLSLVALQGLGLGLLLGYLPGPSKLRLGAGLLLGAWLTLRQTIALIPGAGWGDGMQQIGVQFGLWFRGEGAESPQTLPFVLILLALSWLLGYFLAWLAFPWQRGWIAVLVGGLVLLTSLFYGLREQTPLFFLYLGAGLMLLMNLRLARGKNFRSPPGLRLTHQAVLAAIAALLVLLAWQMPLSSNWLQGKDLWFRVGPWRDLVYGFERLFPMLTLPHLQDTPQAEANWLSFSPDYPFQGERNPSQDPVFKVWAEWPAYWRATTYEIYGPTGWSRMERERQPLDKVSRRSELAQRQDLVQRVELFRASDLFLSATGLPLSTDRPAMAEIAPEEEDITTLRPLSLLKAYQKYQVVSSVSIATPEHLRQAATEYPAEIKKLYLTLPEGLPSGISQLAEQLTREATNPYDKAQALQKYLRQLPYRTDIPAPPPGKDGVSYFLFDIQAGYCDYYASATAVMLRTLGIPARLAVGFASGQYDEAGGFFLVTENETHSWPEVFFPGYGWVEFEPTPIRSTIQHGNFPKPPVVRGGGGSGGGGVEDEFEDLAVGEGLNLDTPHPTWPQRYYPWAFLSLGLLLALPFYWWQRGLFRKSYEAQIYEKMCRLASLARLGHRPNQTPREYAQSLAMQLKPYAGDIRLIVDAYESHAYGGRRVKGEQREAVKKAWYRLKGHLLKRILSSHRPLRLY